MSSTRFALTIAAIGSFLFLLLVGPSPAADPALTDAQKSLANRLAGTYWSWPDRGTAKNYDPVKNGWFRLNADGTATAGWNSRKHYWWPIDGSSIAYEITSGWHGQHTLRFDENLTTGVEPGDPATIGWPYNLGPCLRLTEQNSPVVRNDQQPASPQVASAPVATPAPKIAPPAPTPALAATTRIDELIERKTVLSDDIFGSLEKSIPPSIRDYLADLRENLLDEGARHPAASLRAYDLGARYCNGLIAAYDERVAMEARLRNNAPTGVAGTPTITRVKPDWIDYLRERDEAAAITHNNTIETSFAKMNNLQWQTRALQLRQSLDAFYVQFRAAARQPMTVATKSP